MPIAEALARQRPARPALRERLRLSNALFAAVAPVFPAALSPAGSAPGRSTTKAGRSCARTPPVAAKLRQLVPHLEQRLREAARPVAAIRIKVQPR